MRLPPMSTLAPCDTAPSTCFKRSTSADSDDSGPSVVFSSIGSPAFNAVSAAWNFSRNLSANLSITMNRLAAQQVCPVLYIRPQTAHLTVWSRSASSRTMKASLPPSSIEDGFRFVPARAAMLRPAATLPVSATPLMRGSSTTLIGLLVRNQQIGVQTRGRARVDPKFLERDRALRHDARMLHHQRRCPPSDADRRSRAS